MVEFVQILAARVPLAAGMERTRHLLPAGEPRQFGDLTLTLVTELEEDSGRVRVLLQPVVAGEVLAPCQVRALPVPGMDGAVLIPRAAHWHLEHGRSLPSILMELHAPVMTAEAVSG